MKRDDRPQTDRTTAPPRVVIERVRPQVDGGRFPIKRTDGEEVEVSADIHADGHDVLAAVLRYRRCSDPEWAEAPMEPLVNDAWRGRFRVTGLEPWEYTVEAWVDALGTWRRDLKKKLDAGQDVSSELLAGAVLAEEAAGRAAGEDARALKEWAKRLQAAGSSGSGRDAAAAGAVALDETMARIAARSPDRSRAAAFERALRVEVDRERARFSAWYEMFPRSASPEPGRHGTLRDCEARLDYVGSMGFDVLYLPPIHPIGRTHRKGRNNQTSSGPNDPGSPWAIGSKEGGHTAIHPELGTPEDFRRLVSRAKEHGLEIALDIAFQCAPDHPWVREHPGWFRHRPDGTIQYAENPPKKYQDIYPLEFDCEDWKGLWEALRDVFLFWAEQGVGVFRVDNPHTKPYAFWEWVIREVKKAHPGTIFLSEAFTRPKVMYRLAKLGFTQSYTYFAWRNTSSEIREYFSELTGTPVAEFFRPNLWPNTPDILTEYLQAGGRPASLARFVLAATLGASYGIYGPAFELCENRPLVPGREEYLDSEKYEIRSWEIGREDSLREVIARVNGIRRANPALQSDRGLRFHPTTNDQLIAFSKATADLSNIILTVVNLDPHHTHSGFVDLPLEELGLDAAQPFQVHDLLGEARYIWNGPRNYVELNPHAMPAHVFRVRPRLRTERDFDYYL